MSRHRATEKSKSDDGTFPKSYERCLFSPLYFGKCTIENTMTSLAECKSCVHVFQLDSSDDGCHQKKGGRVLSLEDEDSTCAGEHS